MDDIINIYLNKSINNLIIITKSLENEIVFDDNNLYESKEEFNEIIENVIKLYLNNNYLNVVIDETKIKKYINFNNNINIKLKRILLSIIEYYEKLNNTDIIKEKESSILFLTILIYTSEVIYNQKYDEIKNIKILEKRINNIIDNFVHIKFKKNKDLNKIINDIKEPILFNNEFNNQINNLETNDFHNIFISLDETKEYYKVEFEYKINELNKYNKIDIENVKNNHNVENNFLYESLDILYFTIYKMLKAGINKKIMYEMHINNINKNTITYINALLTNKYIKDNFSLLINYEEVNSNYDLLNILNDKDIKVYLNVEKNEETNNYNMFMNLKNIVINEDFLTINNKYVEIWKDMGMNFIVKNLGNKIREKELIGGIK